jgi:hypothetical protein
MKKIFIAVAVVLVIGIAWELGRHANQGADVRTGATQKIADQSAEVNSGDPSSTLPSAASEDANSTATPITSDESPVQANRTGTFAIRPFEARMLTNGALNENALKLLQTKNFDAVVNALDAENGGRYNPVADKYRNEVQDTLTAAGKQSQIDRFACGTNVCLAWIRTSAADTWYRSWYEGLQPGSSVPIGALSGFDVQLPGGITEHRILFTTQPGSGGLYVKPVQPPKAPS